MRLRDRLRSLFAADYLNAPYTYAELFVCHRCEAVVFDEHAKQLGICGAHRMSGVVPREGGRDNRRNAVDDEQATVGYAAPVCGMDKSG